MKLRQMSTAFISNNGNIAMIKKEQSKLFDFEFWTALGGHMEPEEISSPRAACLREIFEESGLREEDLDELKLRYVLLRNKEDEIRIQYVFFGTTQKSELVASEEGEPHWIAEDQVMNLKLSTIIRGMLEHYWSHRTAELLYVGTITRTEQDEPHLQWSEMKDPLVF